MPKLALWSSLALVTLASCSGETAQARRAHPPQAGIGTRPKMVMSLLEDQRFQILITTRWPAEEHVDILVNGKRIGDTPLILTRDDLRRCVDPEFTPFTTSFEAIRSWMESHERPPDVHSDEVELPGTLLVSHLCCHTPASSTILFRDEGESGDNAPVVAGGFRIEYRSRTGRLYHVGTIDTATTSKGTANMSLHIVTQ